MMADDESGMNLTRNESHECNNEPEKITMFMSWATPICSAATLIASSSSKKDTVKHGMQRALNSNFKSYSLFLNQRQSDIY